jgi:hypothetical protein
VKKSCIVVAAALAVAGCAGVGVQDKESMLSAANFTMKKATTPAQLANLKAMPQNQIVVHVKNGNNVYVYADAAQCQCVYVGNEAAYQNYQQIRIAKNIANEQLMAAQMNQDAMMDWGAWGPWGPGLY